MASFKDINGREWLVQLDPITIYDVRAAWCKNERCSHLSEDCNGFDLGAIDGTAMTRVMKDAVLLAKSLWVVCKEQGEKNSCPTEAAFCRAIRGNAINDARRALTAAIADFFPEDQRELFLLMGKMTETERALFIQNLTEVASDPETLNVLKARMKSLMPSTNHSSSPDSLESAPAA